MKTQSFGWSGTSHWTSFPGRIPPRLAAREDYKAKRLNARNLALDSPDRTFPFDGTYSDWIEAPLPGDPKGYRRIRYDEGPKDREWMQEADRNTLSRLARTGQWDKFDRLKSPRKTGLFGWSKVVSWPEHLEEFAKKLETDYRTTPAQREVPKTVAHEAAPVVEHLTEEQTKRKAEQATWKHAPAAGDERCVETEDAYDTWADAEHKAEACAEQHGREMIVSAIMALSEGRHQDALSMLNIYLDQHPDSVDALRSRAHAQEQLAARIHSGTEKRDLLEAAAADFNTLLDIDVADSNASDGLERVNAALNPSTPAP